jgi:DNA-binding transcriptional LysR family regulator
MGVDRPEGKSGIHYAPRFITTDMLALREAAMAGVGVVQLPILMVKDQLAQGRWFGFWMIGSLAGRLFMRYIRPARAIAIGENAGGFSDGRVCADGGGVVVPQ